MSASVQLKADRVRYSYDGSWSLCDVDLELFGGELLAVVGPNGAGKTTLIKQLARLLRPASGRVMLSDRDSWTLPARVFAQQVAYAPQTENAPLPLTVGESVALGRAPHRGWFLPLSRRDREIIDKVLADLELTGVAHRLCAQLSGGQQRRVILARALAQEPSVLLLDEPTAHLDLKHQTELFARLRQLINERQLAVAMSLHDLNEAANYADRVAVMGQGRLIAVGPPEEVLTAETIERVYGVAVTVAPRPDGGKPWITARQNTAKKR